MAIHKVSFNFPDRLLGKSDAIFNVNRGNGKLGTLRVSKGGVHWIPSYGQKGWVMSWRKFDELMVAKGRKKK